MRVVTLWLCASVVKVFRLVFRHFYSSRCAYFHGSFHCTGVLFGKNRTEHRITFTSTVANREIAVAHTKENKTKHKKVKTQQNQFNRLSVCVLFKRASARLEFRVGRRSLALSFSKVMQVDSYRLCICFFFLLFSRPVLVIIFLSLLQCSLLPFLLRAQLLLACCVYDFRCWPGG